MSSCQTLPSLQYTGALRVGRARRVAVVEHQRVAVGVAEERHVADARVEHLAVEAHAARFERRARRRDVVDVQRDRVAR